MWHAVEEQKVLQGSGRWRPSTCPPPHPPATCLPRACATSPLAPPRPHVQSRTASSPAWFLTSPSTPPSGWWTPSRSGGSRRTRAKTRRASTACSAGAPQDEARHPIGGVVAGGGAGSCLCTAVLVNTARACPHDDPCRQELHVLYGRVGPRTAGVCLEPSLWHAQHDERCCRPSPGSD